MRNREDRISTKAQFHQWVKQDRIMNGHPAEPTLKESLESIIAPNYIIQFLYQLRKVEYLTNCKHGIVWGGILLINRLRLRRMQRNLGFTIPINVFGPGLSIAHYGTIVVSQNSVVGDNCRLHVGVNIGASGGKDDAPIIGNNVYIGPGAILFGNIEIADGILVGANATVNKSFLERNCVIAGTPANVVKENCKAWNEINRDNVEKYV